jgi:hypothetical protein
LSGSSRYVTTEARLVHRSSLTSPSRPSDHFAAYLRLGLAASAAKYAEVIDIRKVVVTGHCLVLGVAVLWTATRRAETGNLTGRAADAVVPTMLTVTGVG